MLQLYLTRHGETIWNTQSRMQGRQDSPLTPVGLEQAGRLADALADVPLSRVWTSPAPRAMQTCRIVLSRQKQPPVCQVDPRIHEMDLGSWEGLSIGEAKALDPDNLLAFLHDPERFRPTGGESYRQVSARMASFLTDLQDLARQCEQDGCEINALVVSHNITLKALFALMERRPLAMLRDGPPIRQAALYRAQYAGRWLISGPAV
ncbi:MAG: histidine phosphatase family protein [Clostridiaceae bacterium]|nr:histidine phosphatase family protein [Clostridiaceae bacterium]